MQLIVQFHPGGHVTSPQSSALEQSTVHVRIVSLHDVQSGGQFGMTQ